MNKWSKEIISLCKQIAEKHKKEIAESDWYISFEDEIRYKRFRGVMFREQDAVPLWTISDCLEFLDKTRDITLRICSHPKFNQTTVEYDDTEYYGKTPLEACLKAILAVVEETK